MTATSATDGKRHYRYRDLAGLPEGKQYEILDGELFVNPSPVTRHQRIQLRLGVALNQGERGEAFIAPLDVVLADDVVVQPDVFFVSRERSSIVTEPNVKGAPDLVAEILSDGNRRHDLVRKKAIYARFRIPLYLVVDPDGDRLELYRLSGDIYATPSLVQSPASLAIAELGITLDAAALFA